MINLDIEEKARVMLSRHGVIRPPVPVEQIAMAERIQVVRSPAAGQESGFLLREANRVMIGLNSNNSLRRQRFTIAHELGHWCLHEGRPLIVDHTVRINKRDDVSSAATDREEIAANAFAAALLMPQPFVNTAIQLHLNQGENSKELLIQRLADEFDVSTEAMNFRLINLGVLSN